MRSMVGGQTMRKLISIAAMLLCSYVLAAPAYAQKAAETVKPAASPSQAVLDQWNDIGRKLVAMAEDFPEDKYDFKPNPAERTFAEQLLHASGVNYFFTNVVLGEKPPTTENPPRDQFKSKAEIAAYVKKAFDDGAAAIKKRGDKGMSELIVDPYSHQQTRINDYAYGFIEHSGEHYGQLVVYYRVAGLVPPESRPKK
jgi:uncharacterized damage-inducible protein DinB